VKNPLVVFVTLAVLAVIAVIAGVMRGRSAKATQAIASGALRGANVLLVTIDTLRADHVGAYGSTRGVTPTIDRLAAEGLRVETAYAHVPLTLPSHTALLTGAYPFVNGVRDNGSFRFDGRQPTLASTLKAAGYRTGAFVAAFVLDARFGLNAGFDVYDDKYGSRPAGGGVSVLERPADQVLNAVVSWITNAGDGVDGNRPWFAWAHLYDPHDPYDPPEPFHTRYASDPYSGEIAFADAQLGVALDRLARQGQLTHTLVVVAADHGESLGEHGERTHGLFAYDATLRVPLVVWAPPAVRPGVLKAETRIVDVMPTVLDLIGIPASVPSGRSVRPLVGGDAPGDDQGSYFEALNANLTRNWAPLAGVVSRGFKLIDLPIPELYDLAADPAELTNLYARRQDLAKPLERQLDALRGDAKAATPSRVDRDTAQRLQSLGYVVAPAARPARTFTARDDPKTLVALNNRLDEALDAVKAGTPAVAERTLKELIAVRPDFTVAYDRLALLYRDTARLGQAIATLESAARDGIADAASLAALGGYLQEAGKFERSVEVLQAALGLNPAEMEIYEKLGVTYTRIGRYPDAHRMFSHMLSVAPNSATTYNNLGSLYLTEHRYAEAIDSLTRAVAIDPGMANAYNGLGVAYARQGQMDRAIVEWRKALELRPDLTDARENLERAGQEVRR
jgi:arylsulfatase A-like enzyme/Flp pilus assembly protein TadD